MSCYFVSKDAIDFLISAAIEDSMYATPVDGGKTLVQVGDHNATQFGAMLWAANAVSVDARYGASENDDMADAIGAYHFTKYIAINKAAAISCARSYIYQSCDADSFHGSAAHLFALTLIERLVGRAFPNTAPWSDGEILRYASETVRAGFAPRAAAVAIRTAPTATATIIPIRQAAPAPASVAAPATAKAKAAPAKAATKAAKAPATKADFSAAFAFAARNRARIQQHGGRR